MKVFVYLKNGSKKVQEMDNVVAVMEDKKNHQIVFQHVEEFGKAETKLNTKVFKTVIYQN